MKYCVFRLYGPLVSWGDVAVGGERRSFAFPSKSAIVGLVAAALGIRRDDEERLHHLSENIGFGVKVISPGIMIRDFHTAQAPDEDRKVRFYTRKDEMTLNPEKLNTILSRREYRCDSMAHAAVWLKNADGSLSIEDIRDALLKPVYHLYLGRKSCPPALPLHPQLIESKDIKSALDKAAFPLVSSVTASSEKQRDYFERSEQRIFEKSHILYHWEKDAGQGLDYTQKTVCYDFPLSRKRWQFAPREDYLYVEERRDDDVHE